MHLTGEERWSCHGLFNANLYSSRLKKIAESCGQKLSLCVFHARMLREFKSRDRREFEDELRKRFGKEESDRFVNRQENRGSDFIVCFESVGFEASLSGVLYNIKALLDVFAGLISRSILEKQHQSFGKGKIDGKELSGGKLVRWLRNSTPNGFESGEDLANLIQAESEGWITKLVYYRDCLAHGNSIPGYEPFHLLLRNSLPVYSVDEILSPCLEEDGDACDYGFAATKKLVKFLEAALVLIGLDASEVTGSNVLTVLG